MFVNISNSMRIRAFERATPPVPQDNRPLRVHFHVQHPHVQFNQLVTGANADEVVSNLKSKVIAELKFPIKLAVMRMTTLEFAQEMVLRYNQAEKHNLPRPASCREFLTLAEAIGYATVQSS